MIVDRMGDSFSSLEKKQMAKIDELQNKIRLLEFDKSEDTAIISELRKKIKSKTNTVKTSIQELELMRKRDDYTRLGFVISLLKRIFEEEENEK